MKECRLFLRLVDTLHGTITHQHKCVHVKLRSTRMWKFRGQFHARGGSQTFRRFVHDKSASSDLSASNLPPIDQRGAMSTSRFPIAIARKIAKKTLMNLSRGAYNRRVQRWFITIVFRLASHYDTGFRRGFHTPRDIVHVRIRALSSGNERYRRL